MERGPVVKGLLTQRGLFTREFESFGAVLWGPVVKVGFTFGPQMIYLETESVAVGWKRRQNLYHLADVKRPRELSLSGFCVNSMDAEVPR